MFRKYLLLVIKWLTYCLYKSFIFFLGNQMKLFDLWLIDITNLSVLFFSFWIYFPLVIYWLKGEDFFCVNNNRCLCILECSFLIINWLIEQKFNPILIIYHFDIWLVNKSKVKTLLQRLLFKKILSCIIIFSTVP